MPVLVAVAGLVLVQHLVPPERREGQNNVAGFIYAVLGVAYAVLLAFVVIAVWQDYKAAQTNPSLLWLLRMSPIAGAPGPSLCSYAPKCVEE